MCGFCGLFMGEAHWTDKDGASSRPARQARLRRVAIANRVLQHYGLKLADWQGSKYVLGAPTGAAEIIDNMAALWPAAESLPKRPCDPLDPALLAELERMDRRSE